MAEENKRPAGHHDRSFDRAKGSRPGSAYRKPGSSFGKGKPGEKGKAAGQGKSFRKPGESTGRFAGDARRTSARRDPASGTRSFRDGERRNRPEGGSAERIERPAKEQGYKAFEYRRGEGTGRPAFQGRGDRRPQPRKDASERPAAPRSDGMPARRIALDALRAVTERGSWASLALDSRLKSATLSMIDRRLCARLLYDCLEHLNYLDAALSQVMAKKDTDIRLRNVLRLGACQLLLEDSIPDMAATDTSVKLCAELEMEGLKGVCNGILRNLIRKRDAGELVFPKKEDDLATYLSVVCSYPMELVTRVMDAYGPEEAERILSASGRDSAITIRCNRTRLTREGFEKLLEKKVWNVTPGKLPDAFQVRGAANLAEDRDFTEGNFSIQSEQSQAACLALAPRRGWTVLDACAAPGGKCCYLAEMMNGTGRVQAWEIREHREKLIEAQVQRLGLENVRPMVRDASVMREELVDTMDAVLLDAPCSGSGEMHDKPDARYRFDEERFREILLLQRQLLETVSSYVKPGGVLVYSTCSILPEENKDRIREFLEGHPEYVLEDLPDTIPENLRGEHGEVQYLPGGDLGGGFYIARLRKRRMPVRTAPEA
ncbi:MAG: 16S rRNA (cytosine(967)-C(5))-methyltransferase RsmB [Clostridia bacterium]|nr:16S rRNA (cytosine(967)-C(5))-methyltransferase RsmB [Clostridia bacterium]